MAILIARLHGNEVSRIQLEDGQEYTIGRAPDSAIVLTEPKGISRQHFKIFQQDGSWLAQSLSRFVPLRHEGHTEETILMKDGYVFHAPPYEFEFQAEASDKAKVPATTAEGKQPKAGSAFVASLPDQPSGSSDQTGRRGNMEATIAGSVLLIPYLRIHYIETDDQEVLKLEGDLWVAGRESTSEITLKDSRASRRHFELSRMSEGYFITDLGSANGTKLNNQRLPPHEPTKVESGDIICVLDIELMFEIRDVHLANRLQNLPQTIPLHAQVPAGWNYPAPALLPPAPSDPSSLSVDDGIDWKNWRNWKVENLRKVDWRNIDYKKHKIRIILGLLAPVLIIGLFQGGGDGSKTLASKGNEPVAFEKLTPEQRNAVKDTFNLARNLYVQGKYELCLAELAKLHEMIPFYENSKELDAFCNQGRELVLRQKDIDRREHEKAMLEQQIVGVVENCKDKLKDTGTMEQVRECLAEAIELNPEHPTVLEMISNAQAREEAHKMKERERDVRHSKMEKGEVVYRKAQDLYKKGKLAKALHEYDKFIETPYPDLSNMKATAKREVASIKKELEKKVDTYLEKCRVAGEKSSFKEAYLACDAALAEDPNNDKAKTMRDQMLSSLRRDMKSIYEDSVLEESLGNVDSAKEKWKKIIQDDLNTDEYAKKAHVLLRKYGVEM